MPPNRRQPGVIRDAIIDTFRSAKRELHINEICAGVEKQLGGEVPRSSVRSYLRLNEGTRFTRTARGTYRLRA